MIQSRTTSPRRFSYQKVADAIRERIAAGEWSAGEQLPNLDDMVERFGYSRMTVFKALQQLESQGVITMGRGRGTFVRRQIARPAIGFVSRHLLDAPANGFATRVALALEDRLHECGWNMRLYSDVRGMPSGTAPWELLEALERRAIIGLVTLNSDLPMRFMRTQEWRDWAVPQVDVSVHRHLPHRVDWRDADTWRLVGQACERFGAGSLGVIGSSQMPNPELLANPAVRVLDGWCLAAPAGMNPEESGYMVVRQLWQRSQRPRALFVNDDVVARGVVLGLLSLGVRTPDDLLLIASHNSGSAPFTPLPTVRVMLDTDAMARELLGLLQALLDDPELPPAVRYITPTLDFSDLQG